MDTYRYIWTHIDTYRPAARRRVEAHEYLMVLRGAPVQHLEHVLCVSGVCLCHLAHQDECVTHICLEALLVVLFDAHEGQPCILYSACIQATSALSLSLSLSRSQPCLHHSFAFIIISLVEMIHSFIYS